MADLINGISNCELVDYGEVLQFSIDGENGEFTIYKMGVEMIPKVVHLLLQFYALSEKSKAVQGPQAHRVEDPWHVTDVASGHHMTDPKTIALRLDTDEGVPVIATMTLEMAQKAIRVLQQRIDGSHPRPPGLKPN